MTNENMTAKSHYAAALVELKAGRHTYAMSHLRESLELKCDATTRVQILVATAELCIAQFQRLSDAADYLIKVQTILAANGNLPTIHRANVAALTAQMRIRDNKHAAACDALREAVTLYRDINEEAAAINAELLLASCLLATGDAAESLAVCRKVRRNPACDSRLLELNVLQAKVSAAMGDHDAMRSRISNAIEGLRTRLGESDFRALAELTKVADVDFGWMINDAAHAEVRPFPVPATVVGEVV